MSIRNLRRWWQVRTGKVETPIDGEVPFWIVSLAFHLVVIILMARIIMPPDASEAVSLTVDDPVKQVEEDDSILEVEFDEIVNDEIGADGDDGLETAAIQTPLLEVLSEDIVDLEMQIRDNSDLITSNDFISASAESLAVLPVKGSVGNSVKAASGAIDRLTQEILLSMQERDTVVVWMFDQSASLILQREEILARFDRIYEELGIIQASGGKAFDPDSDHPLLTQIYAFGAKTTPLLDKPTDSLAAIKNAVQNIEIDSSGIENVMGAVITATNQHASYRKIDRSTGQPKNNVMIIVVSDEAGDDIDRVDEAVLSCTKRQMPVYIVGIPAPFGRAETEVKWIDPDPEFDQSPQWALVSQGPETILPERLRMDFTGTFGDLEIIDSGFGPFHLTRLAYETGGIYFAVHPNRNTQRNVRRWETKNYSAYLQHFFEPSVMRKYKPDYVSNRTYLERLNEYGARKALVQAATFTTTGTLESPVLRFVKFNEADFVKTVSRAQQAAAIIEPQINRLYEMLKAAEEDRLEEISPRWQAGYDLAMGRATAAKVRAESYNAMLALIKTKLKFDPPKDEKTPQNNTWILEPANTIDTGSQNQKLLAKATTYLKRVTEEHKQTPWAMLAERELMTPIGWKWTQRYTTPPEQRNRQVNENNQPNTRPMENEIPKQRRPPPKL